MDIPTLSETPQQPPVIFDATPSSIVQDAQDIIATTNRLWDRIATSILPGNATFENAIQPIAEDENSRLAKSRVLNFYASTSPSKDLRDASGAAQTLFNNSDVELYSREDIFLILDSIVNQIKNGSAHLDDESHYYAEKLHQKFLLNGCGISPPDKKAAFEQAKKRLVELARECIANLNDDPSGIWLTAGELNGVPDKMIQVLRKGTGEHEGQFWLKTKPPHATRIPTYATSEATRKKVLFAVKNRLPQNVSLFRELVLLRDETARLLGYPHYLALKTATKMVGRPEAVVPFLSEIRERLRPHEQRNVHELLQLKIQDKMARGEDVSDTKMFMWDSAYYSRIRREKDRPSLSDFSEYFELYHTLAKLLQLFGHLFDTQFELVTEEQQLELGSGKPLIWHPDVRMYAVWDLRDEKEFLGYAYFDLFPREGKYGHRGTYVIQWGYTKTDTTQHLPSCALVANFIKPHPPKPTLLTLEDARILFHELGHVHHALFTTTRYAAHGQTDRDFAEAPSIMFEQFLWVAGNIQELSCHYSYLSPQFHAAWLETADGEMVDGREKNQPPRQLSDEHADELATPDRKANISRQVGNLFLALYDVMVHSPASRAELEKENLCEMFNKLQVEVEGLAGGEATGDGWEWGHGESVFRMIVGGYDAGYYTYIIGRVYALQMWEREFRSDPLNKEAGRRFRDLVLRLGGSRPEMGILTDYLGEPLSSEPYFQWLGV